MKTPMISAVLGLVLALAFPVEAASKLPTKARVAARTDRCGPLDSKVEVQLSIDGAPMHELVSAVSRALCLNITIDKRIAEERIYFSSPATVAVERLWTTFLAILAVHEATVVDVADIIDVIPAVDGTRSRVPTLGPDDPLPKEERMITKMYVLVSPKDAANVANFLNIFKSSQGQIHPYGPTGLLAVTDFTSVIARLETLLVQMKVLK